MALLSDYKGQYDQFVDDIPSLKRRLIHHNPSLRLDTGPYTFEREFKGLEIMKRAYAAMSTSERAAVDAIDQRYAYNYRFRCRKPMGTDVDGQSAETPASGAPHEGQINY